MSRLEKVCCTVLLVALPLLLHGESSTVVRERLGTLPVSKQGAFTGVAGSFMGVHRDALIIAGGINFPVAEAADPGSAGSRESWHDQVWVATRGEGTDANNDGSISAAERPFIREHRYIHLPVGGIFGEPATTFRHAKPGRTNLAHHARAGDIMTAINKEREQALVRLLEQALIASCQPLDKGPMDRVEHVVAMALAAVAGGARGLRIEGIENVIAVTTATDVPIVGIIKRDLPDSPVRISPFVEDIEALAQAGAVIIAFDATNRERPVPVKSLLEAVHSTGCVAMADCANYDEGKKMAELGCTFIGSTLSGYTAAEETAELPDLELVERWAAAGITVIAEGRYKSPARAAQAILAGAHAVTVGSAITRVEHIAAWFASSISAAASEM